VTTATFNDFSRWAFFRNLSSHVQKYCQNRFGFEIDARLGSIAQGPLQAAGVEVHAHAVILP